MSPSPEFCLPLFPVAFCVTATIADDRRMGNGMIDDGSSATLHQFVTVTITILA